MRLPKKQYAVVCMHRHTYVYVEMCACVYVCGSFGERASVRVCVCVIMFVLCVGLAVRTQYCMRLRMIFS